VIAYQDFAPKQLERAGLLRGAAYETFDEALAAANRWINAERVSVVNVETVVLPNIWSELEEGGTADVEVTTGGWAQWYQFIRVWYQQP
jgi:hypothetical protein